MIEFDFEVQGVRMSAATAPTPAIADEIRLIEADFRNKLEGAVAPNERLHVKIFWDTPGKVDFRMEGAREVIEAAGRRLEQG